jgi:hypothetical protein
MIKIFEAYMKHISCIIAGLALLLFASASADNIFNALNSNNSGDGDVTIHMSEQMKNLLDKKKAAWANKKKLTFSGFRVQAYMGNGQRTSKAEAQRREARIKNKYPELNAYLTFSSPFWKLRIGDFRNHADAMVLARTLKSAFPDMANDIYIVRDNEVQNPNY